MYTKTQSADYKTLSILPYKKLAPNYRNSVFSPAASYSSLYTSPHLRPVGAFYVHNNTEHRLGACPTCSSGWK